MQWISLKVSKIFFLIEIGKLPIRKKNMIINFMWKCKGPRIAKAILKPKTPSDITTKALVIKIMRYWAMDRKDSPDTDLYRHQDGGLKKTENTQCWWGCGASGILEVSSTLGGTIVFCRKVYLLKFNICIPHAQEFRCTVQTHRNAYICSPKHIQDGLRQHCSE